MIIQLAMFLMANNPQHWANVFEGTVEGGAVIIMAEPQSSEQRRLAMDILMTHNPSEMIFRKTQWGVSATQVSEKSSTSQTVEPECEERLTAVA